MTRRALAGAGALLALAVLVGCSGSGTAAPSPSTAAGGPPPSPSGSPLPRELALRPLARFSSPVWVGPAPGDPDHLFLVEKTGRVLQLDADGRQQAVVLDISDQVSRGNEQGLLSIAFDPSYAQNGRLYVDYTDKQGATQVEAWTVRDGVATFTQTLYSVAQPYSNHNGGLLLFDPSGMLLVGLGDGGSAGDPQNRAQDITSDLGKILRLDPATGQPAADNPFPANPRVWALGLRNPWRFSFDTNGDLYLGDVGQNKHEELDVVPPAEQAGANYGWSVYEGNDVFKDDQAVSVGRQVDATLVYQHAEGGCSITGGEVYHGRVLRELAGSYVFGDYCAGELWAVDRTSVGVTVRRPLGVRVDGLAAFGLDLRGELLVMSSEELFRLQPA